MDNDDHLDSDQLTPHIIAALRDIEPAGDALRDAHITSALGHLSVEARSPRRSWLAVAAASLVLVAGGVALGRATTNSKSTFASASPGSTATTVVTKGDLGTTSTSIPLCASRVAGTFVGSYSANGQQWLMFVADETLAIVNNTSCEIASRTPLPTIP